MFSEVRGMETLAVPHHRNNHQCYGRNRGHGSSKVGSFASPPSANFRAINCRTFQAGEGLLPTPSQSWFNTTPANKTSFQSPQTPSPCFSYIRKSSKRSLKCNSVPVPIKIEFEKVEEDLIFSERWAGPAYANSPCPSSLPIPKFSLRPKRTVSLELPSMKCEVGLPPMAKSAPASPVSERSPSPSYLFDSSDSATKTLRRILNLDITDE